MRFILQLKSWGFLAWIHVKIVEKYEVRDILVVVGKQIADILCRFSVAHACRAHSTDKTHENVIVKEEHVVSAYKFLTGVYNSLKLGEYKKEISG